MKKLPIILCGIAVCLAAVAVLTVSGTEKAENVVEKSENRLFFALTEEEEKNVVYENSDFAVIAAVSGVDKENYESFSLVGDNNGSVESGVPVKGNTTYALGLNYDKESGSIARLNTWEGTGTTCNSTDVVIKGSVLNCRIRSMFGNIPSSYISETVPEGAELLNGEGDIYLVFTTPEENADIFPGAGIGISGIVVDQNMEALFADGGSWYGIIQ